MKNFFTGLVFRQKDLTARANAIQSCSIVIKLNRWFDLYTTLLEYWLYIQSSNTMKLLGAFLLVATIVWPLTLAQNVFDCSTISRDLETTPITPVTSKTKLM